ncbi:MAG TPA: pentapeptide repeat-containing protein [Nitrososphaeraceae archaeon]|nr:pentapeptide repeat-containing protein [Nitrososphaeraceae archaeon]
MPKCKFTIQYYDYETHHKEVDFNCTEEEPLASGFCIFHDKDYLLQDKTNYEENKRKVLDRLKHKVNYAISNNEPLLCIGFHLPDFSLSDLSSSREFTKPVYSSGSYLFGEVNFVGARFQGAANFREANFQGEASFSGTDFDGSSTTFSNSEFYGKTRFSAHFNGKTTFNYVLFEGKEKVIFNTENLSNVSFMNTDITGIRFGDKARWRRGKKVKEDRFKVVDERLLQEKINKEKGVHTKDFNLGSIKAVYRSL